MPFVRAFLSRVHGAWVRRRFDADFDAEVEMHLALLTERFERQGMSPDEAASAARRQFGEVMQMKEQLRERRGLPQLDVLYQDFRYAFRQIRKAPAFTLSAVLTLGVGIGASTAVFAVVYAVLLNPLPYPEQDQLASVHFRDIRGTPHPTSLSYPAFFDLRDRNRVFEHLVCYRDSQFTLTDSGQATQVSGEIVAWDLFSMLRVQPQLGRGFLSSEETPGTHVAVFSHDLWQSRFGGDTKLVGSQVHLNGRLFTVVGIAPPGFHFPAESPAVGVWTTLAEDATSEFTPVTQQRGARMLDAMGRLKPGVTLQQAQAQMDLIAADLVRQYPAQHKNTPSTYVKSVLDNLVGGTRKPLMILFGAVGLLLLIACANVANLLLARSTDRNREFALRGALGASRGRVTRQLLVESLVLGLMGSAAGILIGFLALRAILPFAGDSIPRIAQAGLDGSVLAFSIGLAILTSVLFSLAPALQIARTDLVASLKDGVRNISRGHDRLRGSLVVGQITLGLVLLTCAELMIASVLHLQQRDLGFQSDHLLTFNVGLPGSQYKTPRQVAFSDQLLAQLRAIPGVRSAATGNPLPLMGHEMTVGFNILERPTGPGDRPVSDMAIVSPGFFTTMGVSLLKGREFTERDDASGPRVLVVNQAFADKFFPGENVLGKRIEPGATNGKNGPQVHEIVGVVGNAKQVPLRDDADPIYYFPYKQLPWNLGTIVMRTSVPPLAIETAARAAVERIEKMAPVYEVRTMDFRASAAIARPQFQMLLMSSFAGIALLLLVVGLYSVLAYSVSKRRREIGVRIALGAGRNDVCGMVFKEAMLLVGAGLALGLMGTFAGMRLLPAMIYGVRSGAPWLLATACGILIVTGIVAAYLPATRAASVEPMEALRSE